MINESAQLAKAIALKLAEAQFLALSAIEKDILLEDIRQLYRHVSALNTNAAVSNNTVTGTTTPAAVVTETIVEPVVEKEVAPPPVVKTPVEELIEIPTPVVDVMPVQTTEAAVLKEELKVEYHAPVVEQAVAAEDEHFSIPTAVTEAPAMEAVSLNEVFKREENSINNMVAGGARELHRVVSTTTFSGLLDLNKRILFTRELFNENTDAFNAFVQQLERCGSLTDAKSVVNTTALSKQWKLEHEAVRELVALVRQYFESKA